MQFQMRKVLVIDEPEMVSFIEKSISSICDVVWIPRGEELSTCLRRENPDLVLMHYEASECARYTEVIDEIRAQKPQVPIILMPDWDEFSHIPPTANGFITKPFCPHTLQDLIEAIASHRCG